GRPRPAAGWSPTQLVLKSREASQAECRQKLIARKIHLFIFCWLVIETPPSATSGRSTHGKEAQSNEIRRGGRSHQTARDHGGNACRRGGNGPRNGQRDRRQVVTGP